MKILKVISELLFPWKCVFCDCVLENADICSDCEKNLPYTKGDSIYQKFPFVEKCVTPLYYKDKVRESIHRYKFNGCPAYFVRYGAIMAECVENNLDCGGIDVISWIPLSRKRQHSRGYNQSELIAREIGRLVGLPCAATLKKIKNNKPQSGTRDAKQRSENVAGVYQVIDGVDIKGKYILLVDDVVTTGSTLSEAARMLKKAGAKAVYCAALARHED